MKNKTVQVAGIIFILMISLSAFIFTAQGSVPVYQMLSDYQNDNNGGDGWLRTLTFIPMQNEIYVKTFSPYLNQYRTSEESQFILDYDLEGTAPFTIVVLPDTQYYSASYPHVFINQTLWIAQNKETFNIVFVIHLGDIVDSAGDTYQWSNSKTALSILDSANVPYSVLPGNHDFYPWVENLEGHYYYNYGAHIFSGRSYYTGYYKVDNFNNYCLITVENNEFLILNLQHNPSDEVLTWADTIIKNHPDRKVILSTHEFLGTLGRTPIGARIWNRVVVPNSNQVQIVLCGHIHAENFQTLEIIEGTYEYRRVDWIQ